MTFRILVLFPSSDWNKTIYTEWRLASYKKIPVNYHRTRTKHATTTTTILQAKVHSGIERKAHTLWVPLKRFSPHVYARLHLTSISGSVIFPRHVTKDAATCRNFVCDHIHNNKCSSNLLPDVKLWCQKTFSNNFCFLNQHVIKGIICRNVVCFHADNKIRPSKLLPKV